MTGQGGDDHLRRQFEKCVAETASQRIRFTIDAIYPLATISILCLNCNSPAFCTTLRVLLIGWMSGSVES